MIDTTLMVVEALSKLAIVIECIVLLFFAHDAGVWLGHKTGQWS